MPALPGGTAHGETPDAAVRQVLVAQEHWVEEATERRLPLPEPALAAGAALTA